jgi:hypothetical protein
VINMKTIHLSGLIIGLILAPIGCKENKGMFAPKLTAFPVGRFIIDFPEEAIISWGRQGYYEPGPFIKTFSAPTPNIVKEVMEKEAEALRTPHKCGGNQLEKIVEGHLPNNWFIYYWKSKLIKDKTIELKGYFWNCGQGFIFQNDAFYDQNDLQIRSHLLEKHFQDVRILRPGEIPTEPGFCFENAYFRGQPDREPNEHIAMHVRLPSHPDIFMRFSTDTSSSPGACLPNLLERNASNNKVLNFLTGIRELRAQHRTVGPYRGHEVVKRIREGNGKVGYTFMWECPGEPNSAEEPALLLEMMTGHGETPINSSLSRKDALALWDTILNSIRFRQPSAAAKE